ncbi:SAM-dependent methyltransferase, partial [Marinomonas sp.]
MITNEQTKGRFIGVGVGPGDPELITLKALRLIQGASVVSYLANGEGNSQAKNIACEAFSGVTHQQNEIAIVMPMSTDREEANKAYDGGAQAIADELENGRDVVFLCEGDPLFFGSFAYLLERLEGQFSCQVVPGVSSINAASSALNHPLTVLKESFA